MKRFSRTLCARPELNKYLVEIVNLRDQDTWVHSYDPAFAAQKAKELMHMGVAAVRLAHPLADHTLPMNKDVLVVGGGVAGMKASLSLADNGFKVLPGGKVTAAWEALQGRSEGPWMEKTFRPTWKI